MATTRTQAAKVKPASQAGSAAKTAPAVRIPKGPLTVAQARALVDAEQSSKAAPAKGSPTVAARKRASGPGGRAGRVAGDVVAALAGAASPPKAGSTAAMLSAIQATTPGSLAIEQRKLDLHHRKEIQQRIRDYKATLALLQQRGVKGLPAADAGPAAPPSAAKTPPPAARKAGRKAALAGAPTKRGAPSAASAPGGPLRVLAEGDSWFDYPVPLFGGGLVPRLETRLGVPILCLAKAGDESRQMLGVQQRELLAQQLREGAPDGQPWELLLFSGGGNDIVADPMALWLRAYKAGVPAADLLNTDRFTSALFLVRAAYEDLIAMRDALSPQTHIVLHGYDFPIPDGRDVCGIGPWLKPAFDVQGYPEDLAVQIEIMKLMLKQFAAMLDQLQAAPRVTFINAQGTLKPVKASWHNEMHPSRRGFDQIADVFHTRLKQLFAGRVLA